ncbi:MAG: phosphatase PAP2 family protein [Gammaproteobacteria bacterium]|nr:phosphatase PAP2 family protein [Gammaproteobacteria bacterium]
MAIVTVRQGNAQRRFSVVQRAMLWSPLLLLLQSTAAAAANKHEVAGDNLRLALPLSAIAATLGYHDVKGRQQFGASLLTTTLATYALKAGVNKQRPDDPANDPEAEDAFPSGHTSVAFAAAAFLNRRYGRSWGVPAYAAATYVGWSRVEINAHDEVDVIAGALLAVGVNALLVTPYNDAVRKVSLSLWPMEGGGLVRLSAWW